MKYYPHSFDVNTETIPLRATNQSVKGNEDLPSFLTEIGADKVCLGP
jgi:hypothetical protein